MALIYQVLSRRRVALIYQVLSRRREIHQARWRRTVLHSIPIRWEGHCSRVQRRVWWIHTLHARACGRCCAMGSWPRLSGQSRHDTASVAWPRRILVYVCVRGQQQRRLRSCWCFPVPGLHALIPFHSSSAPTRRRATVFVHRDQERYRLLFHGYRTTRISLFFR